MDEVFRTPAFPSKRRKVKVPETDVDTFRNAELEREEKGEEETDDRFYGEGVSSEQKQILDYMDERVGPNPDRKEEIDLPWLKRSVARMEKAISRNAEQRAKFERSPERFADSEADLHAEIRNLSKLTEQTAHYSALATSGSLTSLVHLIGHENTDISADAIEVINELTDEDTEAAQKQMLDLVTGFCDAELPQMLVSNISRLDESVPIEENALYNTLEIVENLISVLPSVGEDIVNTTNIMAWLLQRMQKKEKETSPNKQYSAEILSILLQNSRGNRLKLIELGGSDILLQIVSQYRRRDPAKGEEEEYAANVFDSICLLLDEPEGKDLFLEAEGAELCLLLIKDGKMSKLRAVMALNHAVGGRFGGLVCERLVRAGGLKTIFPLFMHSKNRQVVEHLVGIVYSLFRLLPPAFAERSRLLFKFHENDGEKLTRLLQIRAGYSKRLSALEEQIAKEASAAAPENSAANEAIWYLQRLDAGLYVLQMVDVILAWLFAEDECLSGALALVFRENQLTKTAISRSLNQFLESISHAEEDEDKEDLAEVRDMLQALLEAI